MSRTPDHNPLDRAIDLVAGDVPDPQRVEQAAARVWERLSQEAEHPAAAEPRATAAAGAPLQGCAGFQGLIPAYLRGELSPARALLLEDHTRSCVPCRRALREAREGHAAATHTAQNAQNAQNAPAGPARSATVLAGRRRAAWLSLAAVLVAAIGAGIFMLRQGLPSDARMASVQSIDGSLFRISGPSSVAVGAGDVVTQGEVIRTAKGSHALVRMNDGSLIEMSERASLALRAGRGGNTIALERGRIIVQAAKQRPRHLFVSTGDCLVSVTGTVFAVNHGTKGSRVSVVEGEVRVQQARLDSMLHPGDQVTTSSSVAAVPVRQEIAWSRDAAHYQAMLAELASAGREIDQQIAAAGLRTSTHLLDLAPASTGVFIALPNLAGNLAETHRLLEQRLAQNEELKQWWSGSFGGAADEARYQTLIQEIGDLGQNLGDEIAFTLPLGGRSAGAANSSTSHGGEPVVLAAVTNEPGFRATLAQEVDKVNARTGRQALVLVSDPAHATAPNREQALLWVGNGVFVATRSAAALSEVAGYAAGAANPFVASAFRARIADAYNDGAGWLFASDIGRMVASQQQESLGNSQKILETLGISDLEHFILNYREAASGGEARAALTFGRTRRGVASWLAAPAPMGSLDYFSPDANLAVSFVVKSPVALLDELLSMSPEFAAELAKAEAEYHFDLRTDLAQPLGGEITLGVDGPLLPTPSWKLVAEVYDPVKLQQTFERAVTQINASLQAEGKPGVTLSQEQSGALVYYTVVGAGPDAAFQIHYVFADGYLIAAPSRALLDQALSLKSSGVSLASTKKFHDLLGQDGQVNVSALFYRNLPSLGPLAGALPAMAGAIAGPAAAAHSAHGSHLSAGAAAGGPLPFAGLLASSGPSLFYAYAEDARILFGGKNQAGPLGVNLQALAGFRVLLAGMQRTARTDGEAAGEAAQ
jgi:ferric-dicitrate binding protein FerR (iron transport regulator)